MILTGSRDDVPDLLPGFDVFALSSRFEGLPIALLEAMATGLACVATTVGGIPEVVHDGHDGVLVEPGGPGRPGRRPRRAARRAPPPRGARPQRRRAGPAQFELTNAVRRIERVYDEALGRC